MPNIELKPIEYQMVQQVELTDGCIEKLSETTINRLLLSTLEATNNALKKHLWISCSERLPEVDKQVFVYIYDMPFIAWVDKNGEWNTETFTLDKGLEKDDEPIAWMSLPLPYKKDKS